MIPLFLAAESITAALLTVDSAASGLSFFRSSLAAMEWLTTSVRAIEALDELKSYKDVQAPSMQGETYYLALLTSELLRTGGVYAQYGTTLGQHTTVSQSDLEKFSILFSRAVIHTYDTANENSTSDIVRTFAFQLGVAFANSPFRIASTLEHAIKTFPTDVTISEPLYDAIKGAQPVTKVFQESVANQHSLKKTQYSKIYKALQNNIGVADILRVQANVDKKGYTLSSLLNVNMSLLGLFYQGYMSVGTEIDRSLDDGKKDGMAISFANVFFPTLPREAYKPKEFDVVVTADMVKMYSRQRTLRSRLAQGVVPEHLIHSKFGVVSNQMTDAMDEKVMAQILQADDKLGDQEKDDFVASVLKTSGKAAVTRMAREKASEVLKEKMVKSSTKRVVISAANSSNPIIRTMAEVAKLYYK